MYNNDKILTAIYDNRINDLLSSRKYNMRLTKEDMGEIYLSSGKIVANDPICLFESKPFRKVVEKGRYPVCLYMLHIEDDKRVAFAEVRFSNHIPVKFELAFRENENGQDLGADEFYGYGVDSGTGGFMDEDTVEMLQQLVDNSDDYTYSKLEEALTNSYVHTYSTANICLPEEENNVLAFSSGYGDGVYPSFWGIDNSGATVCLITDFCIIDEF